METKENGRKGHQRPLQHIKNRRKAYTESQPNLK